MVATPEAASRFVLLGVVADTDGQGAALIAVDGKPPRPFRVGAKVADGYVLHSVSARAAIARRERRRGAGASRCSCRTRPLASMIAAAAPTRPARGGAAPDGAGAQACRNSR